MNRTFDKGLVMIICIVLIICMTGIVLYSLGIITITKSKPAGMSGEVITLNQLISYLGRARTWEEEHDYYVLATSSPKKEEYDVVDMLCLEEEVVVLGRYDNKYRVYTKDGKLGWISIKLISVDEPDGVPFINPF